jgi:hypothetical protein
MLKDKSEKVAIENGKKVDIMAFKRRFVDYRKCKIMKGAKGETK